jgi:hypothetical protein
MISKPRSDLANNNTSVLGLSHAVSVGPIFPWFGEFCAFFSVCWRDQASGWPMGRQHFIGCP